MFLSHSLRVVAVLAVVATAGCSGDPDPCYPVRGVLVYEDGQPAKELVGGSVTFTPLEQGRKISSATIEEDGTFVLSSMRDSDGAVAGKHQAVIEPPGLEDQDDDSPSRRPLPAIIDPASAAQEVTVEPKSNDITITVKKAAPKKR